MLIRTGPPVWSDKYIDVRVKTVAWVKSSEVTRLQFPPTKRE